MKSDIVADGADIIITLTTSETELAAAQLDPHDIDLLKRYAAGEDLSARAKQDALFLICAIINRTKP